MTLQLHGYVRAQLVPSSGPGSGVGTEQRIAPLARGKLCVPRFWLSLGQESFSCQTEFEDMSHFEIFLYRPIAPAEPWQKFACNKVIWWHYSMRALCVTFEDIFTLTEMGLLSIHSGLKNGSFNSKVLYQLKISGSLQLN